MNTSPHSLFNETDQPQFINSIDTCFTYKYLNRPTIYIPQIINYLK